MRFIVENFGPIKHADIKLKNLNIFVGKNSTGKSYLTYLIWSLLAVEPDWEKLRAIFDEYIPNEVIRYAIEMDKEIYEKMKKKKNFDFKKYIDELHEINEKISRMIKNLILDVFKRFDEIWGKNLEELLKDIFFVDNLRELIRVGEDKARVIVCDDQCEMKIHFEIDSNGLRSWIDEKALNELENNVFITIVSGNPMLLTVYYYKDSDEYTYDVFFSENYQIVKIIPIIFSWIFDYYPYTSTFIAPDGRAGLVRSREAYMHALLSGGVVINEVDRRFTRFLESLYPKIKNKEISKFADFLESKLGVRYIIRREPPRYLILIENLEIPIQRAPSGYRELAPLVYAMRYGLDEGYVVFIEEPEAHLHPDAQVLIIRTLAGLSKFVNIIITTHSITVLDEISNLLKVRNLPKDKKKKLGYEEWEGLNPENVGLFLFSEGNVKELEVYEDGIEETELDRVIIEIANMHARVEEEYEYFSKLHTRE